MWDSPLLLMEKFIFHSSVTGFISFYSIILSVSNLRKADGIEKMGRFMFDWDGKCFSKVSGY